MRIDIAWRLLFGTLDPARPLNLQIRDAVIAAISSGALSPETRLPSTRALADELGIARNTVTSAYRLLVDGGYLAIRDRSGVFVTPRPDRGAAQPRSPRADWSQRFAIRPSRLPQITKPKDWMNYPYPFLYGQFDTSLFPIHGWRESVKAASSMRVISDWARDMIDDDDPSLIEQLRAKVLPRRGIFAGADEILVTIGSQHALSMLVQLLVGPDTPVGIEDPGYTDVRNMVGLASRDVRALTCDVDGVVPDAVFAGRRVVFVTIGHQSPTTAIMPMARRRELLAMADRHGVVVVEDDYEADLTLEGDGDLPCLRSLDETDSVIHVGSFSKILAPGLRIGYVVAPRPLIDELRVLRRLLLRHPPTNNQRTLAAFISLGHYRQHLQRAGEILRERAEKIAERLPQLLPGYRIRRDFGAKSFWIEGPPDLDCRDLVARARAQGVLVEAGDIFFADPERGRRFFRMGFTSIPVQRIAAGLQRLAELVPPADRDRPEPRRRSASP